MRSILHVNFFVGLARTLRLTLWHPGAFEDFRKKTPKRTWLCAWISLLLYGLRTWSKHQKTRQVF